MGNTVRAVIPAALTAPMSGIPTRNLTLPSVAGRTGGDTAITIDRLAPGIRSET
jgi:hypothetical protein